MTTAPVPTYLRTVIVDAASPVAAAPAAAVVVIAAVATISVVVANKSAVVTMYNVSTLSPPFFAIFLFISRFVRMFD